MVQGEAGEPVGSNSGYPEGCALSCTAMVLAGLALRKYMEIFSGNVLTLSFVDKIELIGTDVWGLQNAIVCLQTWTEMWGLGLDEGKSFTWALKATDRRDVAGLGWKTEMASKDLGAQMQYGKRKSIAAQKTRMEGLDPLWGRLRRCAAPDWQKVQLLYVAFWPKAFYGISICAIGWAHIRKLRTEAMKALKWNKAGANAGLRLGLLNDMRADPGFYQVWHVLGTFRGLAGKQPGLLTLWEDYVNHYQGTTYQGPFAKLLEICGYLKWAIQPPFLVDRHGVQINWLELDDKIFYRVIEDAWTWKLWEDIRARKDMGDIYGLDRKVITPAARKLQPHQQKTIKVLQDGSFVDCRIHTKYDMSKDGRCHFCRGEDTLEHRCAACPALQDIYSDRQTAVALWPQWPRAKKLHLLPSANPFLAEFRQMLAESQEVVQFQQITSGKGVLHLFTDGSCIGGRLPDYSLGAWAVVDPESDRWVARGCLGGLVQNGDRAELRAAVAAIECGIREDRDIVIWSDSSYVTDGIHRLMQNPELQ